jgi:hypothetical protein
LQPHLAVHVGHLSPPVGERDVVVGGHARGTVFASTNPRRFQMPRGSKEKYTDKQKRQAEHIEEGYEERGLSKDEAERRAWATVNKVHGGGEKPGGSGYGKP